MSGATCPQLRRLAFAWVMLPCRDRPTRDAPCGAHVALMANFRPRIAMSWWTAAEFAQCGGPGRDSALHLAEGVPINRTPSRAGRAPRRCRRLLDRPSPIPRAECDQSGADPVESARHLEVDTGDTGGHMSPLDIARSIPIATRGLRPLVGRPRRDRAGGRDRDLQGGIRQQTVKLVALQEVALCEGWVDT